VHKKYISFRRLTKREGGGGGGGGGILIFRLQKFGEKRQFSFSYVLGQNHSTYQTELHPHWIRGPGGRLIQFTTVHELQKR
jgi:hypothetical protein